MVEIDPIKTLAFLVSMDFVAVLISLCATYIPGFQEWFAALTSVQKRFAMFIVITTISVVVGIVSFTGLVVIVSPDLAGLFVLIFAWFSALKANQTTYEFSPLPDIVTQTKNKRFGAG